MAADDVSFIARCLKEIMAEKERAAQGADEPTILKENPIPVVDYNAYCGD